MRTGQLPSLPLVSASRGNTFYFSAILFLCALVPYWNLQFHDFIYLDDQTAIVNNPFLGNGLNLRSIRWAFTTTYYDYWHPLPWLSHLIDFSLYGFNAGGHLFSNAVLHSVNTILLFIALRNATRRTYPCAAVAALFAVHPLNVESVAWAVERKNTLSMAFFLLTVIAHIHYARNPRLARYLLVSLCFSLGIMSKPVLVTVPFLLLLLDWWPLGRLRGDHETTAVCEAASINIGPNRTKVILEKVPLLIVAAAASAMLCITVSHEHGLHDLISYPMSKRIANASVSYVSYIAKTLWPARLAVYYPLPDHIPAWKAIGSALLIFGITAFSFHHRRTKPYLFVGSLWYLGTMVPTIGLVQTGNQSMADRFAYIPNIGLYIMAAWTLYDVYSGLPSRARSACLATILIVLMLLAVRTNRQCSLWENSGTLFAHTLRVTDGNFLIHNNYGKWLADRQRTDEAKAHFVEAVEIAPRFILARYNLSLICAEQGDFQRAMMLLDAILKQDPTHGPTYYTKGMILSEQGNDSAALRFLDSAMVKGVEDGRAHYAAGKIQSRNKRTEEATILYAEAVRKSPELKEAWNELGLAHQRSGDRVSSEQCFLTGLRSSPQSWILWNNLGLLYMSENRSEEAARSFAKAIELAPGRADITHNRALAFLRARKHAEAMAVLEPAHLLHPDDPLLLQDQATALQFLGRIEEAISDYAHLLLLDPDNIPARRNKALCHLQVGEYDSAAVLCSRILRSSPEDMQARRIRGEASLRKGDDSVALADFHVLRARLPGDTEILRRIAQITGSPAFPEALHNAVRP